MWKIEILLSYGKHLEMCQIFTVFIWMFLHYICLLKHCAIFMQFLHDLDDLT